jgi:hypothetical protein
MSFVQTLRERLRQMYGSGHTFEAGPNPDGGFTVRTEIPIREAVDHDGPED